MRDNCEICNGTKLIPFIKDGRLISHAWIDCECKQPEAERYQSIKIEDFDYPMSDAFRTFSYRYCGVPDPGESLEPIKAEPLPVASQKIIVKHHYISPGILKKRDTFIVRS